MVAYVSGAGASYFWGSDGSADITISAPSGLVAGNVLVAICCTGNSTSISSWTIPSGWTQRADISDFNASFAGCAAVFTKTVTSSEPSSYNFHLVGSASSSWTVGGVIAQYSGVDTSSPIDVAGFNRQASGGSTIDSPSISPTGSADMLLLFSAGRPQTRAVSSAPSGTTSRLAFTSAIGGSSFPAMVLYEKQLSSSGATGAQTFTWDGAVGGLGVSVALTPGATVLSGAVALTGSASLSAPALVTESAAVSESATAGLSGSAVREAAGAAALTASGTASISAGVTTPGPAMSAASGLTAGGLVAYRGTLSMTATTGFAVFGHGSSNDDWENAWEIAGASGSSTSTNVGATLQTGEAAALGDGGDGTNTATVWWSWTSPADGSYAFDTYGSTIGSETLDTILEVWQGGPTFDDLTDIVSNDDASGSPDPSNPESNGTTSRVVIADTTAGEVYYLRVYGYDSTQEGDIVLNWAPFISPDFFAGAAIITGADDGSAYVNGSDSGNVFGKTLEVGEPDVDSTGTGVSGVNTTWFKWTPAHHGAASIMVAGYMHLVFDVWTGSAVDALTLVGAIDQPYYNVGPINTVDFTAVAGTTYYIRVNSYSSDLGDSGGYFFMTWSLTYGLVIEGSGTSAITFDDAIAGELRSPPANDDVTNAIVLTGSSGSYSPFSTVASTLETDERPLPVTTTSGSVWFSWDPVGFVGVATFSTSVGTGLEVFFVVGSSQTVAGSGNGLVEFDVREGETYLIRAFAITPEQDDLEIDWSTSINTLAFNLITTEMDVSPGTLQASISTDQANGVVRLYLDGASTPFQTVVLDGGGDAINFPIVIPLVTVGAHTITAVLFGTTTTTSATAFWGADANVLGWQLGDIGGSGTSGASLSAIRSYLIDTYLPGDGLGPYGKFFDGGSGWHTAYTNFNNSGYGAQPNERHPVICSKAHSTSSFNTLMTDMAAALPAGEIWYACFFSEPEDDFNGGTLTHADYQAAWASMNTLRAAHPHGAQVKFIPILMAYQEISGTSHWSSFLTPVLAYADVIGWDVYDDNGDPQSWSFATDIYPAIQALRTASGLPWSIPEYGLQVSTHSGSTDNAAGVLARWEAMVATCNADPDFLWGNYWMDGPHAANQRSAVIRTNSANADYLASLVAAVPDETTTSTLHGVQTFLVATATVPDGDEGDGGLPSDDPDYPPFTLPEPNHWRLSDPTDGSYWDFPINPSQVDSPSLPRVLTPAATSSPLGKPVVYEGSRTAKVWTFSGELLTSADVTALKSWQRPWRVYVTDDFGRTFIILITQVATTPVRNVINPEHMSYKLTAFFFGQTVPVADVPQPDESTYPVDPETTTSYGNSRAITYPGA